MGSRQGNYKGEAKRRSGGRTGEIVFQNIGRGEEVAAVLDGHHVFEEKIDVAHDDANDLENRRATHEDIEGDKHPGEVDGLEADSKKI